MLLQRRVDLVTPRTPNGCAEAGSTGTGVIQSLTNVVHINNVSAIRVKWQRDGAGRLDKPLDQMDMCEKDQEMHRQMAPNGQVGI